MPGSTGKREPKRRTRAKIIVDFATGEVHDQLIEAGREDRGAGKATPKPRARAATAQAGHGRTRRWVKARKVP